MKSKRISLLLGSWLLLAGYAPGQESPGLLRLDSPQYQAEAAKLRTQPARPYEFTKAVLGDVIRFLATDAGLSFFSLPEGSPEADRLITFTLKSSPFQALETLTKANGLSLILDGGIWYVRPADDTELIGRAYEIKYNSMERVTKSTSGGSGGSAPSTGSSSGGGQQTGSSGSSGTDSSNVGGGGVDLQGARETFSVQKSELINDIRAILDLAPEAAGSAENGGTTSSAGGGGGFQMPMSSNSALEGASSQDVMKRRLPLDPFGNIRKPKIIWKSDSNTLYIVATRLQHMWVEGYLAAADQPQSLIGIEVKFIETARDPSSEFGLDWSNTLGTTGTFRQASGVTTDPTTGVSTINSTPIAQTSGGFRADMSNLLSTANLSKSLGAVVPPTQAVLSAQDLSVQLRALLNDQLTHTTSYPRMVTTNNREVVIRSVLNQPVLGGSSSTSLGGGATTSSSISYLPIGTVINILPKKMVSNKINLNISITVSSIIGTQVIQGNPYPIASSRVYSAPVEVDNGYTVAIGGLDEAKEQETDTGVPVLNKIPVLGYLFKSKSRTKDHKNLMLFITPTLVDAKDGGLPSEPQAVLPVKPDKLMPHAPQLAPGGGIVGGIDAIPEAVAFMKRSADELGQVIEESRSSEKDFAKLNDLQSAVDRLKKEVEGYMAGNPKRWDELNKYKWQLGKISDQISKERKVLFKKGYY